MLSKHRGEFLLVLGAFFFSLSGIVVTVVMKHLPAAFVSAMDEDLNIPVALAAIFDAVRAGNAAIDASDLESVRLHLVQVHSMVTVLGIDPMATEWADSASGNSAEHEALDSLIQSLLQQRQALGDVDAAEAHHVERVGQALGVAGLAGDGRRPVLALPVQRVIGRGAQAFPPDIAIVGQCDVGEDDVFFEGG